MNRRPTGFKLEKAIEGFLQYKAAEGRRPSTLDNYKDHLELLCEHLGDVAIDDITPADLRGFLVWLQTDYQPRRLTGGDGPLSHKTARNFWVSLSSFFTWATLEFNLDSPMKGVPGPKFKSPPVEPYTREEVEALLKACDQMKETQTVRRRRFTMRRSTGYRDRALIVILLDTGLRASELCALKIGDLDKKTGKILVKHGEAGRAKFGQGRIVYVGQTGLRTIWRYLAQREDGNDPQVPLFLSKMGRPVNKNMLRRVLVRLGAKAGVPKVHPHRFRHTFAIAYLRSGGDVFTLKELLGHATLDMTLRYSRIAQVDLEQAHRRASPADNWRL